MFNTICLLSYLLVFYISRIHSSYAEHQQNNYIEYETAVMDY